MIESVSACGCSHTAVSTATRGRVTRSAAPRNNCSKSKVVDTIRSVAHFLESIKNPGGSLRPGPHPGTPQHDLPDCQTRSATHDWHTESECWPLRPVRPLVLRG